MIKNIKIQNLRCFTDVSFEFAKGDNLIIGSNGSGKTTILESIGLFSFGRFISISQDSLAIRSGKEVGRVEISVEKDGREMSAEVALTHSEKIFKLMGNKVAISDIIGFVKAVYFNPETIDLVSGSPQVRRREVDSAIAQKNHLFVQTLLHYRNVLKQRNVLLRRIGGGQAKKGELSFWDGELEKYAQEILTKRKKFIDEINKNLCVSHENLLQKKSALALRYLASCDYERFGEVLAASMDADINVGLTQFGPHRDDFSFQQSAASSRLINLRDGASRGEQRMAAIAFKLEVKKYLADGEEPVLIFDDVFSELDERSRAAVAKIIDPFDKLRAGGQLIISATDERVVPAELKNKAKTIKL